MNRQGFHLVEVLMALVLAAGPLLVSFQLIRSNCRGAHQVIDHATARHLLIDLSELLMSQSLDDIRLASASPRGLDGFVRKRLEAMPEELRHPYLEQLKPFGGGLTCEIAEDAGGIQGLLRLRLSLLLSGGTAVSISRHFRPDSRDAKSGPAGEEAQS